LGFITERKSVYCAVRTGLLKYYSASLKVYTNTETGFHLEIYIYSYTIYFYRYIVLYECSGYAFLATFSRRIPCICLRGYLSVNFVAKDFGVYSTVVLLTLALR